MLSAENEESQNDEMIALESILDPHTFQLIESTSTSSNEKGPNKLKCGFLRVNFTFPEGITVKAGIQMENNISEKVEKCVNHLPPLILHFILPNDYPSNSKPIFTLTSDWLDRQDLTKLCRELDRIWEEENGSVILFSWYSFLQDSLIFLDIGQNGILDISWVYNSNNNGKCVHRRSSISGRRSQLDSRAVFERRPEPLLSYLIEFNEEESDRIFAKEIHSCSICLSDKNGKDCQRFRSCGHIFCSNCITEYFTNLITEGSLDSIRCPNYKCNVVPPPFKIKEIVGDDLFERYDRLLLQRTLDSMSGIISCPLQKCQCPLLADPSDDKMAKCPRCFYVFCTICKSVFHGVEPCKFKNETAVYEQYTQANTEEKIKLEKTYGKRQLQNLVETVLSENWVRSKSKMCPNCNAPIEKFEGCNKVTCYKCNAYFCWICLKQLDKCNPYSHFQDPSSKCFNSLFLGVNEEGNENEEDIDADLVFPPFEPIDLEEDGPYW